LPSLAEPKNAQDLLAQALEHGPAVASVVLVLALGVQGGLIVTGSGTHAQAAGAATATHTRAGARPLDLATIVNRHLFGQANAQGNGANAPQTSASLVLAGVLAVDNPERGMAIIGPTATTAKLYPAGADVPGGVRLHAVYNDRVLLDRNGALETLYLPRLSGGVAPPPAPLANASAPAGQRLANFARNNGGLLNGLIRVQPVFNAGKLSGYRLFPGTGGVPGMTRLGLKAGDLVTAVNGTPLDDPNHANDVLQALSNASSATVTILRNGVEEEVNLNLESVAAEAEAAAEAAAANAPPDNGNNGPGGRLGFGRIGPGRPQNQSAAGTVVGPASGTDSSAPGDNAGGADASQGTAPAASSAPAPSN
jgi:general secretion pathway protein C